MNTDAPGRKVDEAEARVLHVQRKLHKWATTDPQKRFDDLFNLVWDRATLEVAWSRVRGNKGSRTAGVDAMTRYHVELSRIVRKPAEVIARNPAERIV